MVAYGSMFDNSSKLTPSPIQLDKQLGNLGFVKLVIPAHYKDDVSFFRSNGGRCVPQMLIHNEMSGLELIQA